MATPANTATVYFIQASSGGPIKIGHARDVIKRLDGLQVGHPERLVMIGSVPGGREVEQHWHAKFAEHRLRGEWFADHPDVIDAIYTYAVGPRTRRVKWGEAFGPFLTWRDLIGVTAPEQSASR